MVEFNFEPNLPDLPDFPDPPGDCNLPETGSGDHENLKELSNHIEQPNSSTKTKGSEPAGRSTRKEGEKSQPKHEFIGHHPW